MKANFIIPLFIANFVLPSFCAADQNQATSSCPNCSQTAEPSIPGPSQPMQHTRPPISTSNDTQTQSIESQPVGNSPTQTPSTGDTTNPQATGSQPSENTPTQSPSMGNTTSPQSTGPSGSSPTQIQSSGTANPQGTSDQSSGTSTTTSSGQTSSTSPVRCQDLSINQTPTPEEMLCVIQQINQGEIDLANQMTNWLKQAHPTNDQESKTLRCAKEFAHMITKQHTVMQSNLTDFSINFSIKPTTAPSALCDKKKTDDGGLLKKLTAIQQEKTYIRLARHYIDAMKEGHNKGISLMKCFEDSTSDENLKAFLNQTMGIIQMHAKGSEECQDLQ